MCVECDRIMRALEGCQFACDVGFVLQEAATSYEIKYTADGVFFFRYKIGEREYPPIKVTNSAINCPKGTDEFVQFAILRLIMEGAK